ncbi:AAA family ATPase [Marinomonas dokdonensis]|uniref:AAA family ATPase n=1 Tax=Marinomonas dokdonensis TaxID=328224 RepID=UPI0040557306
MSGQMYNLIMASVPSFYSGEQGEFTIPKGRFLEYTEASIKGQFQSLDQDAINKLKNLPTMFAVEDEVADARIGKITDIKVNSNSLRIKYRFDKDYYPLTRGLLKEKQQKLDIDDFEFHRGHWAVKKCDISEFYGEYLKSLAGIAHKLKNTDKKVQLIYAFNGTGKTRLSREFRELIDPKSEAEAEDPADFSNSKVLYYNAFTEDLFYWDNDLDKDKERQLNIQPNSFTNRLLNFLQSQGLDGQIVRRFQQYSNSNITPYFNDDFSKVSFSLERGGDDSLSKIKISKGEESCFIWSVFYALLEQVIYTRNVVEEGERETNQFDEIQYVYIDDPVSSLDENHLMQLAVDLASLIKNSPLSIKFIVSTHDTTFYNFLYNELNSKECFLLEVLEDQSYSLVKKNGDSNTSFFYHLELKRQLEQAIENGNIDRQHFIFIRNLYEKTASFLGYPKWSNLLPGDNDENREAYLNRIIQFSSHDSLAHLRPAMLKPEEKKIVGFLLAHLVNNYNYWQQEELND